MQANQKLVASDGYEVALFPLPYLYMSQDEGGDYSHEGTYNLDFLGWSSSGRLNNAPIYAPVTMKVVHAWLNYQGGNAVFFESVNPVHLADGSIDYLTIMFAHDSNPPYTTIGQIVQQGELCYHTGTYGQVTGDHVHTCCGKGKYSGTTVRPTGHTDLTNRTHYWNAVYVNDTDIIQGYHHMWKTWNGPSPVIISRKKFPWVLYARKFREGLR